MSTILVILAILPIYYAHSQEWSIGEGAPGNTILKRNGQPVFPIGVYYVIYSNADLIYMNRELSFMQDIGIDFIAASLSTYSPDAEVLIRNSITYGISFVSSIAYYPLPAAEKLLQDAIKNTWFNKKSIPLVATIDDAGPVPSDPLSEIAQRNALVKNYLGSLTYLSGAGVVDENGNPWYLQYGGKTDVAAIQIYPIPEQELSRVSSILRGFVNFQNLNGKVPFANLQTFGHVGHRLPHSWEFRNIIYQALAVGIKGFIHYSFSDYLLDGSRRTLTNNHPPNDELNNSIRDTNREIKHLQEFFLLGTRLEFQCGSGAVCARWEYNNQCLYVAINTNYDILKTQSISMPLGSGCADHTLTRYSGPDSMSRVGTNLVGDLEGGEVAVWYAFPNNDSLLLGDHRGALYPSRYYDVKNPSSSGLKVNSISILNRRCSITELAGIKRFHCQAQLPSSSQEDVTLQVDAKAPDGRIINGFAWYLANSDGSLSSLIGLSSRSTMKVKLSNDRIHYVSVVVSDDRGPNVYSISSPIQIEFSSVFTGGKLIPDHINQRPIAKILDTGRITPIADCRRVVLDGSHSYDPDGGEIKRYYWYKNGLANKSDLVVSSNASIVSYVHCADHALHVSLAVIDDEGPESFAYSEPVMVLPERVYPRPTPGTFPKPIAPIAVIVNNFKEPLIDINNDGTEIILLDAYASTDQDGQIMSYEWQTLDDDGNFKVLIKTDKPKLAHTFSTKNNTILRLVVHDNSGLKGYSEQTTLEFVKDLSNLVSPLIQINNPRPKKHTSGRYILKFDLRKSIPSKKGDRISKYELNLRSERRKIINTNGQFSIVLSNGSHNITFRVTDNAGRSASLKHSIVIKSSASGRRIVKKTREQL